MRRARSNGQVYYFATEEPGQVSGVFDGANTLVNSYTYTPWGEFRAGSTETVPNPFGFAGREHDDESGLVYMRNRYYDPLPGRFISEDPIGLADGINLYTYAGNNPINLRDPWGWIRA